MTKILTLSFDNHFYLSRIIPMKENTNNLSKEIQKFIEIGQDTETGDLTPLLIEKTTQLNNLILENKMLKTTIESLKSRKNKVKIGRSTNKEDIIKKYELQETDLNMIENIKNQILIILKKNKNDFVLHPENYFDFNKDDVLKSWFENFKKETDLKITEREFKVFFSDVDFNLKNSALLIENEVFKDD